MQIDPNAVQWDAPIATPRRQVGPVVRKPVAPPVSPNYAPEGTSGVTYVPGSAADPAVIERNARIEAAVRAGVDINKARIMSDIQLDEAIKKNAIGAPQQAIENSNKLQAEYKKEPAVNKYEEAIPVYAYVIETAIRPDTAVKAGMLFQAAAKIIDPTSVTMTGEVELQAANARRAGIENELASRYKEYIDGTGALTPAGKRAIINELTIRMKGYNRSYNAVRKDYEREAKDYKLNPINAIGSHAGAPHRAVAEAYNAFQRERGVKIEGDKDASVAVDSAPTATGIAQGESRLVPDPTKAGVNAAVDTMLRRGDSDEAIFQYLQSRGIDPAQTTIQKTLDWRRNRPSYKGTYNPNLENKPAEVSSVQQLFNQAAMSPAGTTLTQATDYATAGIPSAIFGGREALDIQAQENPSAALLGQLTGGLAGGIGGGSIAGRLMPSLRPGLAPLLGELGYSTLAGGGTAKPGERLAGAGFGLASGLAGEAVGRGVLAPAAGSFTRSQIGQRMRTAMGLQPSIPAPSQADVLISQNLGGDPEAVAEALRQSQALAQRQGFEPVMTLADVNPQLSSLAGSAARRSPDVMAQAKGVMDPRALEQISRFQSGVSQTLGPTGNLIDASEALTRQAQAAAKPFYDAAYARPGASNAYEKLKGYFSRGPMKDALKQAYKIADAGGRDPTTLGFDLTDTGEVVLTRVPSWETLDLVKRGLDDVVEGFRNQTTNRLELNAYGREVDRLRKTYTAQLRRSNPEYRRALSTYSNVAQQKGALEFGQKAVTARPDEIEVRMRRASPQQRAQAQLGYRSELENVAQNARLSSDPYQATLGAPTQRQRFELMYPGQTQPMVQQAGLERQMAEARQAVTGGSPTQLRARADEAFDYSPQMQFAADVGGDVLSGQGVLTSAIRRGTQYAKDVARIGYGTQKAEAVAPQLFDPSINPDEWLIRQQGIGDYLSQLERQRLMTGRAGGVLGTAFAAPNYNGQ